MACSGLAVADGGGVFVEDGAEGPEPAVEGTVWDAEDAGGFGEGVFVAEEFDEPGAAAAAGVVDPDVVDEAVEHGDVMIGRVIRVW